MPDDEKTAEMRTYLVRFNERCADLLAKEAMVLTHRAAKSRALAAQAKIIPPEAVRRVYNKLQAEQAKIAEERRLKPLDDVVVPVAEERGKAN